MRGASHLSGYSRSGVSTKNLPRVASAGERMPCASIMMPTFSSSAGKNYLCLRTCIFITSNCSTQSEPRATVLTGFYHQPRFLISFSSCCNVNLMPQCFYIDFFQGLYTLSFLYHLSCYANSLGLWVSLWC